MAPDRKNWLWRKGRSLFRWSTVRKTIQGAALLTFLGLFVASRRGGWAGNLVNIPLRLDPLATISHLLSSRTFLTGSALALIILFLTLVFGRAWCGWLCPLGTTLDLFSFNRWRKKKHQDPAETWRSVKYGLLMLVVVAALFGNLTLLFLDPLTILVRTLTVSIWPALDQAITAIETVLYPISFLSQPIAAFESILRPSILPTEPVYYRGAFLFCIIFLGVIGSNILAQRFWCRYLCPLGGLLGLISKVALFRRKVGEDCKNCNLCEKHCPTGTIDSGKAYVSDPSECTMCLECLDVCPRSSIQFNPALKPAAWNSYDPSRRQVLGSIVMAVVGVAILHSEHNPTTPNPFLIQPPGARDNSLTSKCIRCGECGRTCPTGAIQPAVCEAGIEGLWTPVLIPRMGYCDYSCNSCGQICPVEAIPTLSLEEKRAQVIGKAYINQNRCIAWSDHRDCIVCEEMCPVSNKAITLVPTDFKQEDGSLVTIKLPYIIRERCIGCGICEFKCPVVGESAIRVYTTDSPPLV